MSKTLDELDPPAWGPPPADATRLITRCHELRVKPLDEFSVEDLRLMIGQRVALSHLVPLALARLDQEPLARGDFYAGDLLRALLTLREDFWERHRELALRTANVVDELEGALRDLAEPIAHYRDSQRRSYGATSSE